MTVTELITELQECVPDSLVRLAIQPRHPFEHSISRVEEIYGAEETVVYLGEGSQVRYLPRDARDAFGW